MPKVSVIIPVYGVEKYMERCARSLFEQTLDDIEYLFIDDCTPDRSMEILQQVLEVYPHRKSQVTIHRMEQNSGQAAVRKWGMQNATGEYVIHCDSDDWVDTDMYRAMYEKGVGEDADMVLCGFVRSDCERVLSKQDSAFIENKGNKKQLIQSLLVGRDLSSLCNKLVKTTLLHKEEFLYATNNMWEDFVYSVQFFLNAERICSVDEYFYHYCQNEDSICGSLTKESAILRFNDEKIAFKKIKIFLKDKNLINEYQDELTNLKMHIKEELIPFMDDTEVKKLWKNSFAEIGRSYLINPTIRRKSKIKYLLCDCGLSNVLNIYFCIDK